MIERQNIWTILGLSAFVLVANAIIWNILGIRPNIQYITIHWQHLDLSQLNSELFQSIMDLHSQPPLWNILLGLAAKICNAETNCTLSIIISFNFLLTILSCIILYGILITLGKSRSTAVLSACAFSVLPSTVYYQYYAFYPHLSMFLVVLVVASSIAYFKMGRDRYLSLTLMGVTLLSWLWGVFHPILMIGVCVLVVTMSGSQKKWSAIAILSVAALVIVAPPTKNYVTFGFWGNSSWLGLNLAQVAPERLFGCSFSSFRNRMPHIEHPGTVYNEPSIIAYSRHCQSAALTSILGNPSAYAKIRIAQVVKTMRLTPSDYFFPPLGFDSYPRISGKPAPQIEQGSISPMFDLSQIILPFNIALVIFTVALPLTMTSRYPNYIRKAFAIGSSLILIVLVVGYAANGSEQERMRYTLNGLLFVGFVIAITDRILPWVGELRQKLP